MLTSRTRRAPFTAAGRAGHHGRQSAGDRGQDNTTGIQFDNFQVTPSTYPRAADSKGTNTGDYENGVTLGAAGALSAGDQHRGDFDGVNDHVQMTNTTGIPVGATVRSTELWFKTSSANRRCSSATGPAPTPRSTASGSTPAAPP